MSYLSQLQEALRAPTPFGAALSRVGQSALEYSAADLAQRQQEELRRQQEAERQRQLAQQQAQFIQERLPEMRAGGQFEQMAKLLPTYRSAVRGAYGIDIPGGDVVGAPIYEPQPALPKPRLSTSGSPFPMTVDYKNLLIGPQEPPAPPREIGRDFSGAMTRRALEERFMLGPEMPKYQAVGGSLMNLRTGEFKVPPTQLTAEQKLGVEGDKLQNRLLLASAQQQGRVDIENIRAENRAKNLRVAEALRSARPGGRTKLINVMLDDGTVVRAPDVPGVVVKNPRDPELVQINAGGQLVWGRKVEGAPVYTAGADPFLQQSRRNEAFMGWLRINNPELYSRVYGPFSAGATPLDKQEIDKNLSVFNSEIAGRQPPMPPPMPPAVPTGGIPAPPILPPSTPRPQMTPRVLLPPLPRSSVPPGAPPVPTSPMATPRPTPRPTKKPTTTLPASRRPREAPNPNKAPSDYL